MLDCFGGSPIAERGDRKAGGLSFEINHTERFLDSGKGEQIGTAVVTVQFRTLDSAEKEAGGAEDLAGLLVLIVREELDRLLELLGRARVLGLRLRSARDEQERGEQQDGATEKIRRLHRRSSRISPSGRTTAAR